MQKLFQYTLIAILILGARTALWADSPESLAPIAPFVNDETVMIAKYDLAQLDVTTVVKQWLEPFAVTEDEHNILTAVVEQFDGWSRRLKAEGILQFYIVSSIGYLPDLEQMQTWNQDVFARLLVNTTFAVIPGASNNSIEVLHTSLQTKAKQTWPKLDAKMWPDCRQMHGAAVIGMGTLLDQLNSLKPTVRPEFETALAAAGNRPICAAVVPPPIFARAATEILREPIAGTNLAAGPIIAKGFHWMAIGEEPDWEKFHMQIIVQSDSPQAAEALADAIKSEAAAFAKSNASDAAASAIINAAQLFSLLPEAKENQLVLSINAQQVAVLRPLAQSAYAHAMEKVWRASSMNNLKEIGLGILNYSFAHRELPDRAIRDKDAKPLLSWRVAILPYIEEESLYKEFHLDEPWDSEHNRQLIDRMPKVFRSPDPAGSQPGRTRYLGVVGEHCVFPPDRPIKINEISDGTSKTIMVVEADPDHAVIWTKPDDLEVDLDDPIRGLAAKDQQFNAVFADAHVEALEGTIKPKTLRALFTRDGGETIDPSDR